MNIAVVGGGSRCKKLIELVDSYTFYEVSPRVVAVADINGNAPGYLKALEKGLFVTTDYNDFFSRTDIDFIMELTGNEDVYNDILEKRRKNVRVIGYKAAAFLWEIARVYAMHMETTKQLKETRAKYDVIINEFIHECVMVIQPDYRILDVNETMLKNMALRREDTIGRYCYEITRHRKTPCSGENTVCPLGQTLESLKPSHSTHVYSYNNKSRYYAISCYPLIENGGIAAVINISREITREINMQKTMMQQEKLASIGRLSAGVAHEINNPLTTILTSSMLIQEEIDPDNPIYQELKTISEETLRCRKIVADLLDFARQTQPTKRMCNLNDLVTISFALTKKQAAFNDVSVDLHLSENLPDVYADKDQIEQAMINLILNAIEATAPGGKITLTTHYEPKTETIEISVRDTGIGIPSEHLDKIFDPFFTTTEGGTGLGLAVTHGIIEQHGGTISVESEPGLGTCFTIRMPIDLEK